MALVALASAGATAADAPRAVLSVCADPTDLPFSDEKGEGFENRIAEVLAADLHADLHYTFVQERRSFFRKTLFSSACDVVISVPAALPDSLPNMIVTRPYYNASYVAVTRTADRNGFAGFDDPWLKDAKIGLQMITAEGANPPPAISLGQRGASWNIHGFLPWGGDDDLAPQRRIIDAVASRDIDVAFVWGPIGAYFARMHGGALSVKPIAGDPALPWLLYRYPMALAVRKDSVALRDRLQQALDLHHEAVVDILNRYGLSAAQVAHGQ